MGIIEIENMEFFSYHGCFKEEKIIGNTFLVTLTLEVDMDKASASDNIADALNYQTAYNVVAVEVLKPSNILEHVACRILDALYAQFSILHKATVKVSKLNPPMGGKIEKVSVIQSRSSH